ncbi:MAG TPA: Stf0 family sulfotransferase [Sphingomicrobium sp.]
MLDNFNTGYEGKFDFPPRSTPPERTYLLASVPRAGSTLFSHILWQTGCLGAPLEYMNFEAAGPYGFAASSAALQHELWRSVLRRRCSPNGVFGLKVFPPQLQALQQSNPGLLSDVLATMLPNGRTGRVVYLRRRDRVAQTVSLARAALTGVWRQDQDGAGVEPLSYSQEALEAAERGIAIQEDAWGSMFADLQIEPLNLWHEDVLANPDAAAGEVAQYVGVSIDPSARIEVPEILKQAPGDASDWAEAYARTRASLERQSSSS